MAIQTLDHVNIDTVRLEETRRFFELLGLAVGYRPDFGFPGYWLYAGDRALGHLAERDAARLPSSQCVFNHAAFTVDDFAEMTRRLDAAGIRSRAARTPDGAIDQLFLQDPNGAGVELSQRTQS